MAVFSAASWARTSAGWMGTVGATAGFGSCESPLFRVRMTALVGGKCSELSPGSGDMPWVAGKISRGVAVKPHEAGGQDGADFLEVG